MNLSEHFKLDPASPSYVAWARDGKVVRAGDPAVCLTHNGYYVAKVGGRRYLLHRVVYELTHGHCPAVIDHIDTDKLNNHPDNLRAATSTINAWNASRREDNTSGIKGLSWHSQSGGWRGQIARNGKRYTKRSMDKAEVIAWLIATRNELHKEYANHG